MVGRAGTRLTAAVTTAGLALVLSALLPRRPPAGGETRRPPGPAASSPRRDSARGTANPAAIPPEGWWAVARRVYGQIEEDRLLAVAAGVTFYGLLAVFPAVAAFVSLYGLLADPGTIGDQLAAAEGILPGGAIAIVSEQVKRITAGGGGALGLAFFVGLATSLWSANAGVKAVFDALNVAYEERETRSFLFLNATALAFTLGSILLLVLILGSVVAVPFVLNVVGLGGLAEWAIRLARWPVLLLVVVTALAVLYRFGPSRPEPRWRWLAPGSLMAACAWLVFSMLFSWYVGAFGSYNETYGSLGAAIGFMTWMWLSATIVLIGAEVNAEIERQGAEPADQAAGGRI